MIKENLVESPKKEEEVLGGTPKKEEVILGGTPEAEALIAKNDAEQGPEPFDPYDATGGRIDTGPDGGDHTHGPGAQSGPPTKKK